MMAALVVATTLAAAIRVWSIRPIGLRFPFDEPSQEERCARDPAVVAQLVYGCRLPIWPTAPETSSSSLPSSAMFALLEANQASGCLCKRASRRLPGIPKVRRVFRGRSDLASYFNARFRRRCFMKGSAFSASVRQRSACCFKNELSIFDSNATH
jgi:hypothetical protein